jgi:hypothetical protein
VDFATAGAEPIHTTVSHGHRAITVPRADGRSDRYALSRVADGRVGWRLDRFAPSDDPFQPRGGSITRASASRRCSARSPGRRVVREWTQDEIDLGPDDGTIDHERARSLERLRDELRAADAR